MITEQVEGAESFLPAAFEDFIEGEVRNAVESDDEYVDLNDGEDWAYEP